ncbi:MAG TPA: CoA pyrophosphatase [Bacillota bacterium]|nr:CoA pyrophosphatase [Bacillota bacterium]
MHLQDIIQKMKNHEPTILGKEHYRTYSVLIPLVQKEGDIHLLFEIRSKTMRSQPGDVCFPGGKVDKSDLNEQYAALRETSEELGVEMNHVDDVFSLGCLITEGRMIYPFVGTLLASDSIEVNENEVEAIFTVPLSYFLEATPKKYPVYLKAAPSENFPYELIQGGRAYQWKQQQIDELFYQYDGHVIWGLTAKIIAHFVSVLKGADSK